jgi:hypothetical protein
VKVQTSSALKRYQTFEKSVPRKCSAAIGQISEHVELRVPILTIELFSLLNEN